MYGNDPVDEPFSDPADDPTTDIVDTGPPDEDDGIETIYVDETGNAHQVTGPEANEV